MTVKQAMVKLQLKGVKNLRKFGYPGVDINNLTTDLIYSAIFSAMLKEAEFLLPNYPMRSDNIIIFTVYKSAIKILQHKIKKHGFIR